jgi:hypothetical protein
MDTATQAKPERSVGDMLRAMVAPDSKATLHERDAAQQVLDEQARLQPGLKAIVPRHIAALLLTYYEREYLGNMDTYLTAKGA